MADRFSQEGGRPLREHISAYKESLETAQRTSRHIDETIGYLLKIVENGQIETLRQFDASIVDRYAETLRSRGLGARSVQACLTAAKSFVKWAVATERLSRDPLLAIKKPNPQRDRRRLRRALPAEEWPWLLKATVSGPVRREMSGPERALLYRVAIATGYRPIELRRLTASSVDLQGPPCVRLDACGTKNGRSAAQPIDSRLAEMLRLHISGLAPKAPLFRLPHPTKLPEMLRKDMLAAREAWLGGSSDEVELGHRQATDFLAEENEAGERLDFYSLRCTTATWLFQSAVDVKTAQEVLRHSTAELTIGVYARSTAPSRNGATERLGSLLHPGQLAGAAPDSDLGAQRKLQRASRDKTPDATTVCEWDARRAPRKTRLKIDRKG